MLVFSIAAMLQKSEDKVTRQALLEIDGFDERLSRVDAILTDELGKLEGHKQKLDKFNSLDNNEKR